jgi:uncharacterized protein
MDAVTAHWWSAVADSVLLLQHCTTCAAAQYPPGPLCRRCHRKDGLQWREHAGTAEIVSCSEVFASTYSSMQTPYWVAMVRLADEAIMVTNLVDLTDRPSPGDRVSVAFIDRAGRTVPVFRPDPKDPPS